MVPNMMAGPVQMKGDRGRQGGRRVVRRKGNAAGRWVGAAAVLKGWPELQPHIKGVERVGVHHRGRCL